MINIALLNGKVKIAQALQLQFLIIHAGSFLNEIDEEYLSITFR